jgi:hypothetical protein
LPQLRNTRSATANRVADGARDADIIIAFDERLVIDCHELDATTGRTRNQESIVGQP